MVADGGNVYRFACVIEFLNKAATELEKAEQALQSAQAAGEKVYDRRGRPIGAALQLRWARERLDAARSQASWYKGRFSER